jgi:hypothetical protein
MYQKEIVTFVNHYFDTLFQAVMRKRASYAAYQMAFETSGSDYWYVIFFMTCLVYYHALS